MAAPVSKLSRKFISGVRSCASPWANMHRSVYGQVPFATKLRHTFVRKRSARIGRESSGGRSNAESSMMAGLAGGAGSETPTTPGGGTRIVMDGAADNAAGSNGSADAGDVGDPTTCRFGAITILGSGALRYGLLRYGAIWLAVERRREREWRVRRWRGETNDEENVCFDVSQGAQTRSCGGRWAV
jgi:hypothetical protein